MLQVYKIIDWLILIDTKLDSDCVGFYKISAHAYILKFA